jgi:hypothetical protein
LLRRGGYRMQTFLDWTLSVGPLEFRL